MVNSESRVSVRVTSMPTYRLVRVEGFSLLELIVVLTVLATMTMMVMPVFKGSLSDAGVEHSMRDMHAMIKSARSLAMSEGNEYRIYFNEKKNLYWVGRWSGFGDKGERLFTPSSDVREPIVMLPPSLQLVKPRKADYDRKRKEQYITFFPSGVCSPSPTEITVNVRGSRSKKYRIEIEGITIDFKEPGER